MRKSLILALMLAFPAFGAISARPAVPAGLSVERASVRFDHDGRAFLRMKGDFVVAGNLAALDPREAGFRLSLGGAAVLDGIPEGARVRVLRDGSWRVSVRRAFEGRGALALALDPFSGTFSLEARGWDGSALLAAGPEETPCAAAVGESAGDVSMDFEVRGRRWEFRRVTPPRPGPGGGGGIPLPAGVTTVVQGDISGITSYRFEVVEDDAAWQVLWLAHAGSGSAPAVDFATEKVVGIWLGARPTGGYTASIAAITPGTVLGVPCFDAVCPPQGMFVSVIESQPGAACVVTQAVTHPFHIVRMARATWGGVMVEIETRVVECF